MPRVKLFNQEEALMKALQLFWTKGYEATSLSDLTKELKIGKGSFYDTFGSKRDLFDQCLNAYRCTSFETLDVILAEKENPIDNIKNLIEKHTMAMLSSEKMKGCFIANSTTELSDDEKIQSFLEEHNNMMRSRLMDLLKDTDYEKNASAIADAVVIHVTGISVMSNVIRDKKRFDIANEQFFKIFD